MLRIVMEITTKIRKKRHLDYLENKKKEKDGWLLYQGIINLIRTISLFAKGIGLLATQHYMFMEKKGLLIHHLFFLR